MAKQLFLDWERDRINGLEATVSAGSVQVDRAFELVWPSESDPKSDATAAGVWLRRELDVLGVSAEDVTIVLPRDAVVTRHLALPQAPDEELPDLVRMQAATKSSTPLDQLVLDFLPLPAQADHPGRKVLMVTLGRRTLSAIQTVVEAAGLDLVHCGISSVALGELGLHATSKQAAAGQQPMLIVLRDEGRLEIAVMQDGCIVHTHSARVDETHGEAGMKAMVTEVNRSLIAMQQVHHGLDVRSVRVVETDAEDDELCQRLSNRMSLPAEVLHPLELRQLRWKPQERSVNGLGVLVGSMLASQSADLPAIDFCQPRERVEAKDTTKLKLAVAAAVVVLFFGVSYAVRAYRLGALEDEIDMLETQIADSEDLIELNKNTFTSAELVGDWQQRFTNPREELLRFQDLLPGTPQLYLATYALTPNLKSRAAQIRGVGYAKQRSTIEKFTETLSEAGYRVNPTQIRNSNEDPDYGYRFELNLEIPPPAETPTTATVARSAPEGRG